MSITSSRSSASMAESQTLSTTPPCFRGNQLNPSKMGTLRIEKGDVIICLSDKEEDRLLLDSQTIEQSKHLKASMRDDWNPRSVKKVPDDDEEDEKGKTIWQFGLVWLTNNASERDNGSYVLESGELQLKEDGHSYGSNAYFYLSSDSDALIPHGDGIFGSHKLCCEDPLKRAIAAHKFLLGCLYDRAPDLLDTYMDEAMQVLADAVAYAQYYQMLPVVGTVLRQKYEALPDLSADVAIRSAFHALLAFKLESRVIFDEAFRHLVGGGNLHPGSSSLPTNTSNVDIEILILQNHHKLFEEVNGVLRQIQELTLSKRPVKSNSGKTIVGWEPTKFLQGLRPRKWEEKSRFLAQSVFNQWLSTESLKSTYNEVRMNERSSSDVLVMMRARRIFGRLIAADDAGDISMFGADVPKRLSDYFRIPGRSREAQTTHLAFQLEDLLRQAAEFARPIMSRPKGVKAMPPVPGKTSDHEATFDYFTHRSLPPEFYDDEFKKLDQNYTPLVEFTEASEEWIKVVGLEAVPEQVDVQEEGTMEDNGFHADLDDAPQADWEHEGDNGEEFVPDARDPLW